MKRAQVWSMDFAISLVIFLAASAIAYTITVNTLGDDEFVQVSGEAVTAAGMLAEEGYPVHWTNSTMIRAGLMSDGHLSLRKATELAKAPAPQLRTALRMTDHVYIYFTNASNDTVAVFSQCGIGVTSVNSTPRNQILPVFALTAASTTIFSDANLTSLSPTALANLSQYDVVVLEGNISSLFAGNFSVQQAQLWIENAAKRGITIFIIGDPGFSVLGLVVNATPASSITVQGSSGAPLGFANNELITVAGNLSTIELPTSEQVTGFTPVALTDTGKTAYATWLYGDAKVWYFSGSEGIGTSDTVSSIISAAVNRTVIVSRPICGNLSFASAKQVGVHTRSLPHHHQLLTMHVVVWRS